ncbi:MAG: hypothetical protein J0H64_01180, partial [Actinobacteria bacterium]|nr:hypothetical protein [Actinomycetota bacterium]
KTSTTPGKDSDTPRKSDQPGDDDRLPDTGGTAAPIGILVLAAVSLVLGTGAIAMGRRARQQR